MSYKTPDWALARIAEAKATQAKELDLSHKPFDSEKLQQLPPEVADLLQLETLTLNYNQLTQLPEWLPQLVNLTCLDLASNQLTQLPEWLPQLVNLTYLDLASNQLTRLPETLGRLSNLTHLYLGGNQIPPLPQFFKKLQNLHSLSIGHNLFSEIPKAIYSLKSLKWLSLGGQVSSRIFYYSKPKIPFEVLDPKITELTNLTFLDLSYNQFNNLRYLAKLKNLTELYLGGNDLIEIPNFLSQLPCLTHLYLNDNQLNQLPEWFSQLTNLIHLDLADNQLTQLPEWFPQLTNLTHLDLRSNQLNQLPEWLSQLTNLTTLNVVDTQLKQLPEWISQLTNLTHLWIGDNQLKQLPEWLPRLTNLTHLYLADNQLTQLPKSFPQLTNLTGLLLQRNQLNQLPDKFGQLTKLNNLSLDGNQLDQLPLTLLRLKNLEYLNLKNLPLKNPPPEVTDIRKSGMANLPKIRSYLEQLEKDGIDYLYEAKVLVVGEGGAGKTTLAKKLIDKHYQLCKEDSTEGITVLKLDNSLDGQSCPLNLWDFGGQEIYHATHQFFLSKRAIYLLVADERKENTDFYYWLNVIELLSDNSPVLIIKNKKKGRERELNESALRGRFSNLVAIISTDLAIDDGGLDQIWREIRHQVAGLPHIGTQLPKSWVRVRRRLEADERNYIDQAEFLEICTDEGLSNDYFRETLSNYLHDLGVCLHFRDNLYLKNTVILKPTWGTDAVYRVLDDKGVMARQGQFSQADLAQIWHDPKYKTKQMELLELMKEFQLCYEIPNQRGQYIAPQLLPEGQPTYEWADEPSLILRYTYEFMPKGIITRFIVAVHHQIARQDWVWKSGVILERDEARAEVIECYTQSPKITIRVQGRNKQGLLEIIRHEFGQIHDTFLRLQHNELIPCNCDSCRDMPEPYTYPLDELKDFVANQQWQIQCRRKPYHMVSVLNLISDVVTDVAALLKHDARFAEFDERHLTHITHQTLIQGDAIMSTTHNTISDSTGVAIGQGDAVGSSGSGHAAGRDQLIEQTNLAQSELVTALLTWQKEVAAKIDALTEAETDEKVEMKEEVQEVVEEIQAELAKGNEARPSWIARRLNNIANMGEDIVELTVATLANPFAGAKLLVEKIDDKIKLKRAEEEAADEEVNPKTS